MIEIETKHFGKLPVDAGQAIEFPAGLPAFEQERLFIPISHPRTEPLILLQSVSTPGLCFLALPVATVDPEYRLQLSGDDLRALDLAEPPGAEGSDLAVLALVAVGTQGQVSANLMSPVVVNRANRRAVQAVRWDGEYQYNHPVAQLAGAARGSERPCS